MNNELKFDKSKIQSVKLNLLNGQVEILLRALELYGYNLEYMLNSNDSKDDSNAEKKALLNFTYEQVLASQAEQVNGKSNNKDTVPALGKLLLDNTDKNTSNLKIV